MSKTIKQAKNEYKCIFCGSTTYFEDEGKAYCIDCYCKLRNSAHTHDLPKNTPINPMPTINPNTIPVPWNPYPNPGPYNPLGTPLIIC